MFLRTKNIPIKDLKKIIEEIDQSLYILQKAKIKIESLHNGVIGGVVSIIPLILMIFCYVDFSRNLNHRNQLDKMFCNGEIYDFRKDQLYDCPNIFYRLPCDPKSMHRNIVLSEQKALADLGWLFFFSLGLLFFYLLVPKIQRQIADINEMWISVLLDSDDYNIINNCLRKLHHYLAINATVLYTKNKLLEEKSRITGIINLNTFLLSTYDPQSYPYSFFQNHDFRNIINKHIDFFVPKKSKAKIN